MLFACKDDLLTPAPSNNSISIFSYEIIDLPGIFAIDMTSSDIVGSRADILSSDTQSYDDGLDNEYDLAAPDDKEFYHYLILYKTTDADAKPIIFPIDVSKPLIANNESNITLTVSKMFKTGDEENEIIETVNDFKNLIQNTQPYILLNFKFDNLSEISLNPYDDSSTKPSSTYQKLQTLTRSQLEKISIGDYKIRAKKSVTTYKDGNAREESDFFIMSSSVYSDNNKKIVDGEIDINKIFNNPQSAIENPALTVHVERLASKVTVSFNLESIEAGDFDPNGKQNIKDASVNQKTGLPEFRVNVQEVDMSYPGGIKSDLYGYEIMTKDVDATIRILGYGLGNLETQEYLFKDIDYTLSSVNWTWNDPANYRSYWANDLHYKLASPSSAPFANAKVEGYPHQFRLALDTDTVASYHKGLDGGYNNYVDYQEDYTIHDESFVSYNKLGEIETDAVIDKAFLKYKSFQNLCDEFQNHRIISLNNDNTASVSYTPFYSLENTYYDPGSLNGTWIWPWQRVPFATATNLIVLAEIEIDKKDDSNEALTLYSDQNNNFYLEKVNLLNSKLAIFNNVLRQGNSSGIKILNGKWDRHQPVVSSDTQLDKITWKAGSVLWFAEVNFDSDGNPFLTGEPWQVNIEPNKDDILNQDLDLIPAEISGGDGQALIAPAEKFMGKKYRYYLAPVKTDQYGTRIMNDDLAVEINYNQLVALFLKIIGPINVYDSGKMYFSAPIPHRISSFSSENFNEAWKTFGAFSLVRNNWYHIEITEFTQIGTPVHFPSQPILPVMDGKHMNIGVKLHDWFHTSVNGWSQEASRENW